MNGADLEKESDLMGIMVKSSKALERTTQSPPGSEEWHNSRELSVAISLIGIGTSLAAVAENLDRLVGNRIADTYAGAKPKSPITGLPQKERKRGSKTSD